MIATTKIADRNGIEHAYEHRAFPFDECLDLGLELAAVVGGPLGESFKALLMGGDLADGALDEKVLTQAVAGLGDVPARLIARGGSALIARILATTTRIGTDAGGLVKQSLGDASVRDAAYSGGNLIEAIHAVKWVLQVNYGPFLTGLWDAYLPALSELAGPLMTGGQETQQSESSEPEQKPSEIVC